MVIFEQGAENGLRQIYPSAVSVAEQPVSRRPFYCLESVVRQLLKYSAAVHGGPPNLVDFPIPDVPAAGPVLQFFHLKD
jgi:hypothetical protein